LGEVLRGRVFVYVGSHDNYYLNEGVERFEQNVNSYGGAGWVSPPFHFALQLAKTEQLTSILLTQANVTILEGKTHGGNYQTREIWNYLEFLDSWFSDHSPTGPSPIHANVTTSASRGNLWEDVIASAGRQAALDRQTPPTLKSKDYGRTVVASVGRWDPGVKLEAQWWVGGECQGESFDVVQGQTVEYVREHHGRGRAKKVRLEVTGRKMGYVKETRKSDSVTL
jgi:hypothetical protein